MTLTIGQPGTIVQPEISVDNNGYWVVNGNPTGVKAVGEDGKMVKVTRNFELKKGNGEFALVKVDGLMCLEVI